MQQHLKLGGDYYCWIVSQDKSADDTPENQLGDAENTSKDTSEDSSVDIALQNEPGGAENTSKDTSEDSSVDIALKIEPGGAESASISEDRCTTNMLLGISLKTALQMMVLNLVVRINHLLAGQAGDGCT